MELINSLLSYTYTYIYYSSIRYINKSVVDISPYLPWPRSCCSPHPRFSPRLEATSTRNFNTFSRYPLRPHNLHRPKGVSAPTLKLDRVVIESTCCSLLMRLNPVPKSFSEVELFMSYRVNHQKHISEYLQRYTTGTPKEIANALPKAKRTPASYSTVTQALILMLNRGRLKRVGPGTYASAMKPVSALDVMSYRDECHARIIQILESRKLSGPVPSEEIYEALGVKGFGHLLVARKLRQLKALGVVTKIERRWALSGTAFGPVEWSSYREGTGFDRANTPGPTKPSRRTPCAQGVLGEAVPAHNVLRVPYNLRSKALPPVPSVTPVPFSIFE